MSSMSCYGVAEPIIMSRNLTQYLLQKGEMETQIQGSTKAQGLGQIYTSSSLLYTLDILSGIGSKQKRQKLRGPTARARFRVAPSAAAPARPVPAYRVDSATRETEHFKCAFLELLTQEISGAGAPTVQGWENFWLGQNVLL